MSSPTESPKTSPGKKIKQLPMKLGRKIKHQLHRISSMGHVRQHLQEAITSISPLIHPIDRPRRSSVPISPPASSKTDYSRLSLRSTKGAEFSRHTDSQDSLVSSRHSMDGSTPRQEKQIQSTSADELVSEPASELVVEDSVEQPGLDDTGEPRQTVLPEEPTFLTSAVHVELGIPDPFLVDDDTSSEEEAAVNDPAPPSQSVTSNEVPLALPPSPRDFEPPMALTVGLLSTNVNKAVPPLPADSETDEDEAPDLYLPGLLLPTMFLPIPNTDPLTILLTKYIYPPEKRPVRDVTGDWQRSDFHTLVASAECNNLFVVLNAIEPLDAREWVFSRILPFELEVINARVKYWAGDHMGHLDVLIALLRKCRSKARQEKGNEVAVAMWKERGARVCLIIASQLVEMKDYRAAVKLLEPLCEQGETSTAALRSSIGRIYLQSGEIQTAVKHFEIVSADPLAAQELKDMNAGLLACAEGDWPRASSLFTECIARDTNDFVAVNNLAVALLGQGKLQEVILVVYT
ncbi:hypothetical protein C0989_006654 [Termitomyces sp. Mn162]|nr:hypothetical protein C0989_006654 [Termitomyces sp. Mn162]